MSIEISNDSFSVKQLFAVHAYGLRQQPMYFLPHPGSGIIAKVTHIITGIINAGHTGSPVFLQ